ncbi:23S rRNA (guanosine(2251)-2'-O)-methyltransferase RlmB [Geotalea uraniireducens]|uniref:23S rRNA (Guanosine(2251)-2'-O)-methyltransferase RlmB n=1 Tax=Geotalea uraniireducens TaxID=351604 RepID=A0ABN6VVC3_9BACT|nr:23S rRNA (guanosine(2251)-2'-O)-methyltransferase RlmB [Geotalea uraniireducens]BDV43101.1 23S rRNA (guanosine(2251)-2'-O)-methyltransferase RlmB [Geotalea uraniireducens]
MKDELLYGINAVSEALRGKRRAFELFLARDGHDRRLEKLLTDAAAKEIAVHRRNKADLTRLCGTEHHQGVALRLEGFPYVDLDQFLADQRCAEDDSLVLALDCIQDPHNLGALIRSAACAGATGVLIPKDRAARVTATVERSAAGATETIPIVQVTNLAQTLTELKGEGFWIYGTADTAAASLYEQRFSGKVVVVIGAEGEGMRPLVRKQCDFLVSIPLRGGVNSLNASVAGGVVLFEILRQRLMAAVGK